ncbi:hypothetical protein NDU88_001748 [Pleurodeles waltl]|uniref:Uncharacterized protein n=1 Tax=Pleurodeles waltl TaxID=8319 RepID=A0AAV7WN31_PLEWA|nr:hypothetical protein NDU88_001748 [Pleurodeles waltl]
MGGVQSTLRRTSRRRRATRNVRVIVRSDGTLSMDRRRPERDEVGFMSDHAPLLLECGTHTSRPAGPLWRMRPELLGDLEYRHDIQEALTGYFGRNWTTAQSRGMGWEALKVVIRGKSLTKTYVIRKKLDLELTQQEDTLGALQRQIDNGGALEAESQVMRARLAAPS